MSAPTIRPFRAEDAAAVEAILSEQWSGDPTMRMLYGIHRVWDAPGLLRLTLAAEQSGQVVGLGTLFESTFHPETLMAAINVAPAWQRQGIGTALFDALAARADARPWIVKATERDAAGMGFLRKRGFWPRVRTLTGLLDPRDSAAQAWLTTLPDRAPGCTILPLGDPANPTSIGEQALTHAAIYRQHHAWNPPAEEDEARALAHYCERALPGSELSVVQGGSLIGAGNLIADPFEPERQAAYLVNFGVTAQADEATAAAATAALARRLLLWAGERGIVAKFEADDTYTHQHAVLSRAPAADRDDQFVLMTNQIERD